MQFAERFIRRPVLASMVSLGLVLVGLIGYTRLPVREFPDADSPVVTVTTFLPGARPLTRPSSVPAPAGRNALDTSRPLSVMRGGWLRLACL